MIRWTVAALAISLSMSTYAVDGYKNLKFGMSKNEIKKANICSFKDASEDGTDAWQCMDFKFGDKTTMAFAYFIDNKFQRLGFIVDMDKALSIAKGLKEKYGGASSMSEQEEFDALNTTPGAVAYIKFDNDTVILKMTKHETIGPMAMIIYTTPDYEHLAQLKQTQMVSDDL
ncbi:hypothetical protein [Aeromonas sp. sif2416]|uniref:hypothetical protein n=1 Tax=Aeromonas sp. sif2416 TaxID=2854793 RepID=UPI001C449212|nr:hypothetical protein [Aeromonas sp. sif2416]MBV7439026.1 hypothetical protein [Aeromonas sp. sif2416]